MEHNPEEAVKNNIIGTKNVAEAADMCGTETFVLISSDKAVNPANVMGATKRFAEMVIMNLGKISRTKFAAVRFGNVLGSRGSVIPIFKSRLKRRTRHRHASGDDKIFYDDPRSVKTRHSGGGACKRAADFRSGYGRTRQNRRSGQNLIHLSGYTTEQIPIEFSGIRPGEKMYEELLNHNEVHTEQIFPKIHIGKAVDGNWAVLIRFMEEFSRLPEEELRKRLFEAIESVHEEAAAGV